MESDTPVPAVQMAGITKMYPGGVVANDGVALAAFAGEIHAIVGENGAGKSTLMGVLYGSVQPDAGRIRVRGCDERIDRPARAIALGIALVSQHTSMIPALTLWENACLGAEAGGGVLSRRSAIELLERVAAPLDVQLDWRARAADASVAALQKAEIVKALRRGASILILDEPTAALAPPEADALFGVLHGLAQRGTTVLLVTHRLREVMEHAARVTILRAGKVAGERLAYATSADELLALMIGPRAGAGAPLAGEAAVGDRAPATWEAAIGVAQRTSTAFAPPMPRLEIRDLTVAGERREPAVSDCSLSVAPGEIVGVAGVDGNGQRELAQAIAGLRPVLGGRILLDGRDITGHGVRRRMGLGVRYVPEDRVQDGLVAELSIAENLELGTGVPSILLDRYSMDWSAREVLSEYRVAASGAAAAVATLSGGNQQKLLVARALDESPTVVVAAQPTRGLDVASTRFVYERLRDARARGAAILIFSLDLDEIMEVSDRVAVMFGGRVAAVLPRETATAEAVGRLMVGGALASEGSDG